MPNNTEKKVSRAKAEPKKAPFVQITATATRMFALDADGGLWMIGFGDLVRSGEWERVTTDREA